LSSGQDNSVSSLWTPYGEHEPREEDGPTEPRSAGPAAGPAGEEGPPGDEVDPEVAEELHQLREQLAATPVGDIVANHAVGLWQLAIVHLAPEGDTPPRLDEARIAIDAMASLVEGLGERLGAHEAPLRDALAQLRLVYVQVSRDGDQPPDPEVTETDGGDS
jgi:hypothetical protein